METDHNNSQAAIFRRLKGHGGYVSHTNLSPASILTLIKTESIDCKFWCEATVPL